MAFGCRPQHWRLLRSCLNLVNNVAAQGAAGMDALGDIHQAWLKCFSLLQHQDTETAQVGAPSHSCWLSLTSVSVSPCVSVSVCMLGVNTDVFFLALGAFFPLRLQCAAQAAWSIMRSAVQAPAVKAELVSRCFLVRDIVLCQPRTLSCPCPHHRFQRPSVCLSVCDALPVASEGGPQGALGSCCTGER